MRGHEPKFASRASAGPVNVGRRDQQGAHHRISVSRLFVFRPPGDSQAAEIVPDENDRPVRAMDSQVELVDPGIAVRIVPHSEIDPLAVAALRFPQPQPVPRPVVAITRHQEDQRISLEMGLVEFEIVRHGRFSEREWPSAS